jgi:transposase
VTHSPPEVLRFRRGDISCQRLYSTNSSRDHDRICFSSFSPPPCQLRRRDRCHTNLRAILDGLPHLFVQVFTALPSPKNPNGGGLLNERRCLFTIKRLCKRCGLPQPAAAHTGAVLCCDEKSQIQALNRTQPGLPLGKGHGATLTHDYKRHGTTTLFAALSTLDGKLIGACMKRHRHQEWIKFLTLIDRQTPAEKQLHLVVDNYSTHKHPRVLSWLRRHPRFHIHFTPTSGSWLNMVERWFRDLTSKRLRRGVFKSVPQLIEAIESYITQVNQSPKAFVWTAKASDNLEKVKVAREALNKSATG